MIKRKKRRIRREATTEAVNGSVVSLKIAYRDPAGHPYVGYMDGDAFVPNKETLDAFSERSKILSEHYCKKIQDNTDTFDGKQIGWHNSKGGQ